MPIQIKANIRQSTVKLIGKIIFPLVDTGVVTLAEYNEIMSNLRYLSKKGTLIPDVLPKLIKTKDVADILGISSSQFRQLESENFFPFRRRNIGKSVRFCNIEVVNYIMQTEKHHE